MGNTLLVGNCSYDVCDITCLYHLLMPTLNNILDHLLLDHTVCVDRIVYIQLLSGSICRGVSTKFSQSTGGRIFNQLHLSRNGRTL